MVWCYMLGYQHITSTTYQIHAVMLHVEPIEPTSTALAPEREEEHALILVLPSLQFDPNMKATRRRPSRIIEPSLNPPLRKSLTWGSCSERSEHVALHRMHYFGRSNLNASLIPQ